MSKKQTGGEIRQAFIDFFINKGHKFVQSSSLVPGSDPTLLFTNAGMVQFKDIFLGTDKRDYSRAVNSQKCMRVSGKHNDLDDVGRDDYHHTFFEMLGNWSFGDYYKKEAIEWAWELLTRIWELDTSRLWVTCFKDEKGEIETDKEVFENWSIQPGIKKDHILYFGRKENFWEMADTGPCGPCSEIHFDRGEEFCDRKDTSNHRCSVNGDCHRFLELWNLVFIQYNRTDASTLVPLPQCHVDTGMGLDRIVCILQNVDSNYRTDLLYPILNIIREITGQTENDLVQNFTPYRVIADHGRAAAFLIADGVVPGNIGRNYICRMIIRRAARFGTKLGLNQPFLGKVTESVVDVYGNAYPELKKNRKTIIESLTREEDRFQNTLESGLMILEKEIQMMQSNQENILDGRIAFNLYATHGLPLEITRDVLQEKELDVDQEGFYQAMEEHRLNSGAGKEFGLLGGEGMDFYANLAKTLKGSDNEKELVKHDPYHLFSTKATILAIIENGEIIDQVNKGSTVEIVLSSTGFYIESGGQVSDTGIISIGEKTKIRIDNVRKPAAGIIIHIGEVIKGNIKTGDEVIAKVDLTRRQDIMRNHTATHLLHAALRIILGEHVRQAGSLVAPDRLRFDFTHPKAIDPQELKAIEKKVNEAILENHPLEIKEKNLNEALDEGAIALFGEKYGDLVRTVSIGKQNPVSYELCGGTHVKETEEIGSFIITSEGSVASGIRRIEAITGRKANELLFERKNRIERIASIMETSIENVVDDVEKLIEINERNIKKLQHINLQSALQEYNQAKEKVIKGSEYEILTLILEDTEVEILRQLADKFRNEYEHGIGIFSNIDSNGSAQIIVIVSDSLVEKNYHAGNIIKSLTEQLGGSGGGRPQLAQGGVKNGKKIIELLNNVDVFIQK